MPRGELAAGERALSLRGSCAGAAARGRVGDGCVRGVWLCGRSQRAARGARGRALGMDMAPGGGVAPEPPVPQRGGCGTAPRCSPGERLGPCAAGRPCSAQGCVGLGAAARAGGCPCPPRAGGCSCPQGSVQSQSSLRYVTPGRDTASSGSGPCAGGQGGPAAGRGAGQGWQSLLVHRPCP